MNSNCVKFIKTPLSWGEGGGKGGGGGSVYDSLNYVLLTDYSTADNVPWAQFPTLCALLGRRL